MIRRLSGVVAATFTPMREDGSLDLARVPAIVDHLARSRVAGLYVNGTTGEGPSLSGEERRAMAEAWIRAAKGRLPVIVQVGHHSLREARELAAHAQQAGADAISAIPPAYFKPDSLDALVACMGEVAAGAPELPFFYYHIPMLTGVQADMVEFIRCAAERIPNFAGLKFTATQMHEFQACLEAAGDRVQVLYGHDEMLLSSLMLGGRGAVGSTYNFAAPLYYRLIEAFQRGDLIEARRCQSLSVAMIRILVRHRIMPALKAAMTLIGLDCGPVRLPLQMLSPDELAAMKSELDSIGFFEFTRVQPAFITNL